ncbi:MAG: translation initiation factor IF-1 [Methylacidiphilales bacterium]|nr:translation initiation factor IF-1 [Candidatus Methylacidiphilales bacterium]MDW8348967.1 translation initiation factor IF-1 [Verrucomicrobiae bacterium]
MSANSENIQIEGTVVEVMNHNLLRVSLSNGHRILCHAAGEMRLNFIKVLPGDKVLVELSPYDLTRGRVISRK